MIDEGPRILGFPIIEIDGLPESDLRLGRYCLLCGGAGYTRDEDPSLGTIACPACDATGVEPDPCATCNDTGSLPIEMDQYGRPVDHYDCPDCTVARRVTRLVRQAKRREMH